MWSNWSRAEKAVVVVVIVLAVWEGVGLGISVYSYDNQTQTQAQGSGGPIPLSPPGSSGGGSFGCLFPWDCSPSTGSLALFNCIESPTQFSQCVLTDVLGSVSQLWNALVPFVENFLGGVVNAVSAGLVSIFTAVENAVVGAVSTFLGWIVAPFTALFNVANTLAQSTGPVAPIVVTLIVALGVVALVALLGFIVLILWGVGKTAFNLL